MRIIPCLKSCLWTVGLILAVAGSIGRAEETLTIDAVIDLCASGKPESEIITEIRNQTLGFEMNVPVMQKLINGGVSPAIIQVLLSRAAAKTTSENNRIVFSGQPARAGLTLITDPPGMTVFIDGIRRGVTPFLSNKMEPGKHVLRVDHPFFITQEKEFEMKPDQSIFWEWTMESREPFVRVRLHVFSQDDPYPWSWVIRSRETCPEPVSLSLVPWPGMDPDGSEAAFILSDTSKRTFTGSGSACLEVFLWRGKIRRDLPIRELPPCTSRFFISGIEFNGMNSVYIDVKLEIPQYNPTQPQITLESETGRIVETGDKSPPPDLQTLREQISEQVDLLLQ